MIIEELLPFPIETLIVALVALAAGASVLAVWVGMIAPRPMKARMKALNQRRASLHNARLAPKSHPMRITGLNVANLVTRKFRLLQTTQSKKVTEKLMQAGWRGKDAMIFFMFMKLTLPIAAGIVAVVLIHVVGIVELPEMQKLAVALGAVIVGAYAPDIFVHNAAQKRQQMIQKAMPDGLDLMVICAEAGLSLDATLERVGRELRNSWPEMADEVSLTSIELNFLPERRMALDNLTKRIKLGQVRALVNTMLQTERYGTPLSQALRVLSSEMRVDRLTRAEEKAARLPAILTVPMILFILPALFVVLIGPGALRLMDGLRGVLGG